jgi:hypothetical protein
MFWSRQKTPSGSPCSGTLRAAGRFVLARCCGADAAGHLEAIMNGIIYLIGLIVVIMAILSLFGLR